MIFLHTMIGGSRCFTVFVYMNLKQFCHKWMLKMLFMKFLKGKNYNPSEIYSSSLEDCLYSKVLPSSANCSLQLIFQDCFRNIPELCHHGRKHLYGKMSNQVVIAALGHAGRT